MPFEFCFEVWNAQRVDVFSNYPQCLRRRCHGNSKTSDWYCIPLIWWVGCVICGYDMPFGQRKCPWQWSAVTYTPRELVSVQLKRSHQETSKSESQSSQIFPFHLKNTTLPCFTWFTIRSTYYTKQVRNHITGKKYFYYTHVRVCAK